FIKTTPLYFLLCTIFRIICINRCFHCVVDNHFSLAWLVVQIFDHFFHRNDRICRESVSFLNLFQRALGSFSALHAVQGYHQALDLHIALCLDDRECFLDGFSGSGHILNDHHTVSVLDLAAQKDSCIPVILHLFPVGTVPSIHTVQLADRHGSGNAQRNAFVCRSEEHVKIQAIIVMDRLRVILTQTLQLCSCHVSARVHEKWGFSSALQRKLSKFQYLALHH